MTDTNLPTGGGGGGVVVVVGKASPGLKAHANLYLPRDGSVIFIV